MVPIDHLINARATFERMGSATETIVFVARRIITIDPGCPSAEAVAVRDGQIVAVGSLNEVCSNLASQVVARRDEPHSS